ncbi:hypothetical protein KDW65_35610 [Burkholderia cenocepacia]|uniref:hypothetical protein n=1 Tax=Burkholderia cenocepacia TaxID=95486 RepID=UPI001B99C965|nr:hypothetical protein [Burkholderia cenocepacia]MBR8401961.1 hypothetical protein [Burkholderia cenocepacia]
MALDLPSIEYLYDFAYLDRGRIDFYFAQLFEDGVLTQTKRTARDSSTDTSKIGGSLKVISGETSGSDVVERGLERMFDPTWLAPIEVLNRLDELSFVHREIEQTPIGGMFLSICQLSIIDIRMLKDVWDQIGEYVLHNEVNAQNLPPKEKQRALAEGKKSNESVVKVIKNLPHAIQATFSIDQVSLWSTLRTESMLINPDDLALKHGAQVPGDWYVLGIVDAHPSTEGASQGVPLHGINIAMGQMLTAFREMIGRPETAYGVTPIAIFRPVRPTSS